MLRRNHFIAGQQLHQELLLALLRSRPRSLAELEAAGLAGEDLAAALAGLRARGHRIENVLQLTGTAVTTAA